MCGVKDVNIRGNIVRVADIKEKYILNIVNAAEDCDCIDKVVMFGSAITKDCEDTSDIDLAVFGNQAKGKALTSIKFRQFLNRLSEFDDFNQTYDVLYFKTGAKNKALIMNDIERGEVRYAR